MKSTVAKPVKVTPKPNLIIGVYSGATEVLSKLDFSFLNLNVLRFDSNDFRGFIESISINEQQIEGNQTAFRDLFGAAARKSFFCLVPVNHDQQVEEKTFQRIQDFILIMKPSAFRLEACVTYKPNSTKWFLLDSWEKYYSATIHTGEKIMSFANDKINTINSFVRLCFEWDKHAKDFELALQSYVMGLTTNYMPLAHLTFCMALESLIEGDSEVSYKVSRTCALLNSNNKKEGEIIFKNMKKIYDLRSRIIHGSTHDVPETYFFYAQTITSTTLITLITLKCTAKSS